MKMMGTMRAHLRLSNHSMQKLTASLIWDVRREFTSPKKYTILQLRGTIRCISALTATMALIKTVMWRITWEFIPESDHMNVKSATVPSNSKDSWQSTRKQASTKRESICNSRNNYHHLKRRKIKLTLSKKSWSSRPLMVLRRVERRSICLSLSKIWVRWK